MLPERNAETMEKNNVKDKEGMLSLKGKISIILVLGIIILFVYICMIQGVRNPAENQAPSDSEHMMSDSSSDPVEDDNTSIFADNEIVTRETNAENILKDVLSGDSQFLYADGGNIEAMDIADIPLIFDAEDPSMKIWNFAVVDLDRDGEKEVVLSVVGVAGDMGGKMIFHKMDDKVYGYISDHRTLEELKTDGTFGFSDPTGIIEGGIGEISDFSELGYTIDKISYGTGTHEGWDTFVVDHHPATEEEYFDAVATQNKKLDVEWYDFLMENIEIMF